METNGLYFMSFYGDLKWNGDSEKNCPTLQCLIKACVLSVCINVNISKFYQQRPDKYFMVEH